MRRYIVELVGCWMESEDIVDTDDTNLGIFGACTVGLAVLALDLDRQDLVLAEILPDCVLGCWGVAALVNELRLSHFGLFFFCKGLEVWARFFGGRGKEKNE